MDFYFSKNKTPETRYQKWDATTTLAIWTPRTGNRLVLTDLKITPWGAVAAGTFAIYLGSTSTNPVKVAEFGLAASAMVRVVCDALESTGVNYVLYGTPSAGGTSSHFAFAEGFEVEG